MQFPQWNGLNFSAVYTLGSVWEQSGECIERATSLRNGSHFEPVAENHNRNQRCELPPNVDLEQTKCRSERSSKSNNDGQADERHHAGLAVDKLSLRPAQENEATVNEDDGSEDWRNESRTREGGRCVPKPMLDFGRPDHRGDREGEAQPEFVPKHRHRVPGVTVVTSMGVRHLE